MVYQFPARLWRRATGVVNLKRAAGSADAFLASYPKSGRTWFRFLLSTYFNAVYELGVPVDLHSMFQIAPNFDFDPLRGIPAASATANSEAPHVFVTHVPYRPLLFRGAAMMFMVRDPRDVMVSAYFHATRQKRRFEGSIQEFLVDERQGLPAMIGYLNGWAAGLERHRHIVLSYEKLTSDTEGTTAEALRFLDCPVDSQALAQAVSASRFEAMRDREIQSGLPSHDYDRTDQESLRMRKGQVGGFGEYLADDDVRLIERTCSSGLNHAAKLMLRNSGVEL